MFASAPQDTRRVVEFGRPDAMNPEERWVANMQVKPLTLIGRATLAATAVIVAVNLWYAWIYWTDPKIFLVAAATLTILDLITVGLPIAWVRTRDNNAIVARAALGVWGACVLVNVYVVLSVALYVPPPLAVQAAIPHPAQPAVRAPNLSQNEIERLDDKISELWYLANDYEQELARATGAKRERLLSARDQRRYALAKTELQQLEIRRYGAPVVLRDTDPNPNGPGQLEVQGYAASEPAPAQAAIPASAPQGPGLFWVAILLVLVAAWAVGLLISAESLAAVMLAKVREGQARPVEDLVPEAAPLATGPRIHGGESLDGFALWIGKCLGCVPRPCSSFHATAAISQRSAGRSLPSRSIWRRHPR